MKGCSIRLLLNSFSKGMCSSGKTEGCGVSALKRVLNIEALGRLSILPTTGSSYHLERKQLGLCSGAPAGFFGEKMACSEQSWLCFCSECLSVWTPAVVQSGFSERFLTRKCPVSARHRDAVTDSCSPVAAQQGGCRLRIAWIYGDA